MRKVMVCVTGQRTCERLIRAGAQLLREEEGLLSVVNVAKTGFNFLGSPQEGEALEYLFTISKQYGADMTMLRADDVPEALVRHAQHLRATHIVMGAARRRHGERDVIAEIQPRLPQVNFLILNTGE